ncbi:tyrosine-protein phosphatase [Amycolatopsis anabasis]|uniref:tyrosine-protein phosphatase n=1 Tax=Amycolatopsis anabasis TaxID=1840409 RepID=UPI001FE6A470|nr:tyrosine-protein phosphatase [Amycolatopsis anabasis]
MGATGPGLIVLLLALADVPAEAIAADYALSAARLEPAWRALGLGDQNSRIDALLTRHGTTARQAVIRTLASLDVPPICARPDSPAPSFVPSVRGCWAPWTIGDDHRGSKMTTILHWVQAAAESVGVSRSFGNALVSS